VLSLTLSHCICLGKDQRRQRKEEAKRDRDAEYQWNSAINPHAPFDKHGNMFMALPARGIYS
jgi:hypothetical protein